MTPSPNRTSDLLAPGLWRLPLPSRTMPPFDHTNHYLVADGGVGALIEAGFADPADVAQIHGALEHAGVRFLKAILLTHTHPDHVAGLGALQAAFPDAVVHVHPEELERLAHPDVRALQDARALTIGNRVLRAIHTPGHSPGHLSFFLEGEGALMAGDLVAGQGSSWVGHPEGDVGDYLKSLARLAALNATLIAPGHGEPSREVQVKLEAARRHRLERLEQVYTALSERPLMLEELRVRVYPVPDALVRLSEMSLLALLKHLMRDLRVLHLGADEAGPYAQRR